MQQCWESYLSNCNQKSCIVAASVDYGGSTYELITVPKKYSTARQACQNRDMDLAVITDEDENAFVYSLIR